MGKKCPFLENPFAKRYCSLISVVSDILKTIESFQISRKKDMKM